MKKKNHSWRFFAFWRLPAWPVGLLALLLQLGGAEVVLGVNTIVTNQLGQGVVYRHYHYDSLDGGPQEVYITDINLSDPAVSVAFPFLNAGRTVSAHAGTVPNAAVAVNGQFFVTGGAINFLRVHGTNIYASQAGVHDEQALVDDGLKTTNSIRVLLRPGGINSWTNLTLSNILSCGVNMIQNGVKITGYDTNDAYITDNDPRTCAAITYDNHLLLMCVDGRSSKALGMTIPELRDDVFTRGSISNAFSLDGGGSTDMWGRGIGVANQPSDGEERAVADAVVIAAAAPALPLPPANLAAASSNTGVLLTWALSSGAMSYNVKRSTNGSSYATIGTATATSFSDGAVPTGLTYHYAVSAVNTIGESANSAAIAVIAAPGPPTNLTAVAGNNQVILNWNASPGATGYLVNRSTGGSFILITKTAGTSYTNSGLGNGVTFYYEIMATNIGGVSVASAQVSATPICADPSVPLGLRASSVGNAITLSWQAATNAQTYTVSRATALNGTYFPLISSWSPTNYTDTGPTPGLIYFYVVSAQNSCGTSAQSVPVSAPLLIVSSATDLTNIVLQGWGGAAGATYFVLGSSDLTLPSAQWTVLATNIFGPNGFFAFTNAVPAAAGAEFYSIQTTTP